MSVSEAVEVRKSIRAFLDKPVEDDLIRKVLTKAARAPSGGNVQPWRLYVLNGDTQARFKALLEEKIAAGGSTETPEYDVYPPSLKAPYRDTRFKHRFDLQLSAPERALGTSLATKSERSTKNDLDIRHEKNPDEEAPDDPCEQSQYVVRFAPAPSLGESVDGHRNQGQDTGQQDPEVTQLDPPTRDPFEHDTDDQENVDPCAS